MNVKSFFASKASTVDTLVSDIDKMKAKLSHARFECLCIVVNRKGEQEITNKWADVGFNFVKHIGEKLDTFNECFLLLDEKQDTDIRLMHLDQHLLYSEWSEQHAA